MFVRVKRIKGQEYGYLVENSWTGKGPRQKVASYLGKVLRPAKVKSEGLGEFAGQDVLQLISGNIYADIVAKMLLRELHNHDVDDETEINTAESTVKVRGKNAVFAINEGFLCGPTLQRLLSYNPDDDYSGFHLADLMTGAGMAIEKDAFVTLFQKLQQQVQKKKAEDADFYY